MNLNRILCISLFASSVASLSAQSLNYFGVEGTKWIVSGVYAESMDEWIERDIVYSLEGSATVGGHDCLKYHRDGVFLYYVYTEGDKVYCIRPDKEDESLLIYDFGLQVGDDICLDIVSQHFNTSFDPHSYQHCIDAYDITSCGYDYEVMVMTEDYDLPFGNQCVKGIGSIDMFVGDFGNWGYDLCGASNYLSSVEVNGETIFSVSDIVDLNSVATPNDGVTYQLNGTIQHHPHPGLSISNGRVVWRK